MPLIGAWAGSKWMIPWADEVGWSRRQPGYKSTTQWWWAIGATIGSFLGAPLAACDRPATVVFPDQPRRHGADLGHVSLTAPLEPSFLPIVFAQGLVATLFFGWLPLYLPELFPVQVRATGAGLSMNIGRFATAGGVLAAGSLFTFFGSDTRRSAPPALNLCNRNACDRFRTQNRQRARIMGEGDVRRIADVAGPDCGCTGRIRGQECPACNSRGTQGREMHPVCKQCHGTGLRLPEPPVQ